MILWVKKEATGRPNDQRAELLKTESEEILVRMCGDGVKLRLPFSSVCGVEIDAATELFFELKSCRRTTVWCASCPS